MSIEEIEIRQTKQGFGFVKPVQKSMEGVKFSNGKIAYLAGEDVQVASDEKSLVSGLKQETGCIGVDVVHKYK
jgi:hypothetical protein